MNTKLFYNVDKNLSETFKNDTIAKNTLGIVNADEGETFGYIISYNSQITPSYMYGLVVLIVLLLGRLTISVN